MALESSLGEFMYPIVGWLALSVAIGVLAKLLLDLKQAVVSEQWSVHIAMISEIGVHEVRHDEEGATYEPKIRYSYRIHNRLYESDRFSYRQLTTGDYGLACKPMSGLVAGKEVTIYVNPNRPNQSVVLPGADFSSYVQPALAVVFLVLVMRGLIN